MQQLFMQIYSAMRKVVFIHFLLIASVANLRAQVPTWAQGAVWYQIFPDRFRNGDTTNDPTLADIHGCWPHNDTAEWQIMPWGSEWYALQPWELANGQDFNYNVQRRRYGGDLQGILDQLPYLDSLGITAVYLNPVFVAPSLHKYDAAMYHHIEPTFGPDPEGDKQMIARENPIDPATWQWTSADLLALKLIAACHARGMHIIFDGVFNHMGVNSFAFQDVQQHQQQSPYADWFIVEQWANPQTNTPFVYTGWFGAQDLPEFKEDSLGIVAGPRKYIFDCTQRWMAPDGNASNGIDGWRLDVAFCVDMDFWRAWRLHVKTINPNAYLTAEINNDLLQVLPYVEGDAFDAVMHYSFAALCTDYFIQKRISVNDFVQELNRLTYSYTTETRMSMMNLYDSHDTPRLPSVIHNPQLPAFSSWGEFLNASHAWFPGTKTDKPDSTEYALQKLMAVFQYTWIGAPMIYYGDEVGMWGANDPDCRKPMVWKDIAYQPETLNWYQEKTGKSDTVQVQEDLLRLYRKLGELRLSEPALRSGGFLIFPTQAKSGMIYFTRMSANDQIDVFINTGKRNRQIRTKYFSDDTYSGILDLLTGTAYVTKNNKVKITIPPGTAMILKEFRAFAVE